MKTAFFFFRRARTITLPHKLHFYHKSAQMMDWIVEFISGILDSVVVWLVNRHTFTVFVLRVSHLPLVPSR